ncbi:MAG: FMN-binding negative transcriptional regulator [Propionibacteriaceae bacterium]|jgi:transcriptional regulator|nr:FMN-binding negative transcriptional regulator [Propionibacteriaceae bacterium]
MYTPAHFRMPEADVAGFIERIGTGTLITTDPGTGRPHATFLPWAYLGDRLTTHIGLVNPQAAHSGEALVIVMGENAYVSERWLGPGAAPSWNYETVHLYGELVIHRDPEWINQSFRDLIARFSEKSLDSYDPDWLEKQTRACVGAEVIIREVEAKSKLSQSSSELAVRTVADQLEATCPGLAARMRDISLPHIAEREQRIRAAVPFRS